MYEDGSRESYNEAYYGRVLLREAECHKNLKCSQHAIKCYLEVLEHEDTFGDAHQEALHNMFEVWRETKAYSSVMNHFRSWRDADEPGLFDWIMKIAHLNSVHLCLLDAAVSTASHEEIINAYRLALDTLEIQGATEDDDAKQAVNQLRYVLATVLFYGSDSENNHQEAFDIWENLILDQNNTYNSWSTCLASARKLFRSLLEKAGRASDTSECQYTIRLAKLATMEHEDLRKFRQSGKDPRLSLARIKHLQGHTAEGRLILRERLRSAFDGWSSKSEDDEKLSERYSCLTHSFTVIRDDVNAIAAWQASKPKTNSAPNELMPGNDISDEHVVAGAEATAADSPPESLPQGLKSEIMTTEIKDGPNTSLKKREPYQEGYYCDGECGDPFDVSSNSYICRDCLDVQFCAKCHAKLKDGQISPTICSSLHDFLHVPAVDEVMWEKLEGDQMIVGDVVVAQDVWINRLRDEWDLKQEQIDLEKLEAGRKLKAARTIARFILNWKRGQKKKSTEGKGA